MIKRKKLFTWMIAICLLIVNAGMARYLDQNLAGKSMLWYKHPANSWMTQALPIGNGPMGAILFGSTDLGRIQFNEISLWTGHRAAQISYKSGQAYKVIMVKKYGNQTPLFGVYIILIIT